jgi:hypothetical protein
MFNLPVVNMSVQQLHTHADDDDKRKLCKILGFCHSSVAVFGLLRCSELVGSFL